EEQGTRVTNVLRFQSPDKRRLIAHPGQPSGFLIIGGDQPQSNSGHRSRDQVANLSAQQRFAADQRYCVVLSQSGAPGGEEAGHAAADGVSRHRSGSRCRFPHTTPPSRGTPVSSSSTRCKRKPPEGSVVAAYAAS